MAAILASLSLIRPGYTCNFCYDFKCDFLLLMDVNEWMSYECSDKGRSVKHIYILRTFITYLLVHIHQKKKIALEMAAKIASVNGPTGRMTEVLAQSTNFLACLAPVYNNSFCCRFLEIQS